MPHDYRVTRRSNSEVRQLAKKARLAFGIADARRVDILACVKSPTVWTVRGTQRLNFQVRPDAEMGPDDASTSYGKGIVTIAVKQSVYDAALVGEGRARNTLAHELGHAVMHDGPPMARRAEGNITPKWIKAFESAEHQAKVFAAAFLINDEIASRLSTAEEISIELGVSLESATIYLKELVEPRERERIGEQILRLARDLRAEPQFLKELCTNCHRPTVLPLGSKFMCKTCNAVFDRFQDGDSIEG
jgi:hypothetical protein